MVPEDGRLLTTLNQIVSHQLVDVCEELCHALRELAVDLLCPVDLLVVLALGPPHLQEGFLAHLDLALAHRVVNHIAHEGLQGPGVVGTAQPVVEGALGTDPRTYGILAVLAHIGDDIGKADHAAL